MVIHVCNVMVIHVCVSTERAAGASDALAQEKDTRGNMAQSQARIPAYQCPAPASLTHTAAQMMDGWMDGCIDRQKEMAPGASWGRTHMAYTYMNSQSMGQQHPADGCSLN